MQSHEELPVFTRWSSFLDWLLGVTEKLPKRIRGSISLRLENLALDVLEGIVEAAYTKDKADILKRANLNVEKLRVLLRICHRNRYIGSRSFKFAIQELYECGSMLGGWMKSQKPLNKRQ